MGNLEAHTYTTSAPQFKPDEYQVCLRRGHKWTELPYTYTICRTDGVDEGYCSHCGIKLLRTAPQPARVEEAEAPPDEQPPVWNERETK